MKKVLAFIAAAMLSSSAIAATYPFSVGENVVGVAGGLIGRLMGPSSERANVVEVWMDGTPTAVLFGREGYLVGVEGRRNRGAYKAHYQLADCGGIPYLEAYTTPKRAYPFEVNNQLFTVPGYAADVTFIYASLPYSVMTFTSWRGEDNRCHNEPHADYVGKGALKRLQNGAPFAIK